MSLTNEEYLESKGSKCPVCSSTELEAGQIEFDGSDLIQEVKCLKCDAEWDDVYSTTLQGYDNLQESE